MACSAAAAAAAAAATQRRRCPDLEEHHPHHHGHHHGHHQHHQHHHPRGTRPSSASPRRRRRPSDAAAAADEPCACPFTVSPLSEPPPRPDPALAPHRPASPIIGAEVEERAPPPPPPGRRGSAAAAAAAAAASMGGSPPGSPHFAAFHAKPCGGKPFSASATSAFSRYPHRSRERPTSLLLDTGGPPASDTSAGATAHDAPLYKSLSMLSIRETDGGGGGGGGSHKHHARGAGGRGKHSPVRRRTSSDLATTFSSAPAAVCTDSAAPAPASPPFSPARARDLCANLPPLRPASTATAGASPLPYGSPAKSPAAFSPFPTRPSARQPKELGVRLGLYARDSEKSS